MDKASFDTYVEDRYRNQLDYYDRAALKNQKKYKQFQWLLIVLSALTPVLAAISDRPIKIGGTTHNIDLQILVIVVSAVVAILTTGLKTFNYQELNTAFRQGLIIKILVGDHQLFCCCVGWIKKARPVVIHIGGKIGPSIFTVGIFYFPEISDFFFFRC